MVNYYYKMNILPENLSQYPSIIEQMNNCLTEFTGEENIIKIDMDIPYPENLPQNHKDAQNIVVSYFMTKQMETGNGFINVKNEVKDGVKLEWYSFNAQFCGNFSRPHIQVGGINGNDTISIRSMSDMTHEQREALTDKMDLIVKDYVFISQ